MKRPFKKNITQVLIIIFIIFISGINLPQTLNKKDIINLASNPVKFYTNKDGLPQSNIISSAIDNIGRLWIGTQDGAAFYNGRRWEIINMPQVSKTNYVQVIKVTQDSSIWFGILRGGVARLYKGSWEFFSEQYELPSNYILSIAEERLTNGRSIIWIGTNKGIAKKLDNEWEIITTANEKGLAGNIIYNISQAKDGTIWIATNKGVSKYFKGKWEIFSLPSELRGKQIYKVLQSNDGNLWFGSNGVLGKFDNKNWQIFYLGNDKKNNVITSIHQSRNGTIWISSTLGVWKIRRSKYDAYSEPDFIKFRIGNRNKDDLVVWSISETSEGSLWFGTFLGLVRYTEGRWKELTEKMSVEQGGATAIIQTKRGDYYFGTETGLLHFKNGKIENVRNITGAILYLYEDQDEVLWVSVFSEGVYRFKDNIWKRYQKNDGLADNNIWFIYQSSDKSIWFGSDAGVSRLKNNRFTTYRSADGLNDNTILCMYESIDSTLWFGTTNGVTILKNGLWKDFSSETKLSGIAVNDIRGYNIGDPIDMTIWFATLGNGIYEYKLKTKLLKNYNTTQPPYISNNSVYRIEEDKSGRLYFLTNNKITRFTFINKEEIFSEKFGVEDGLPNDEGISSASFVDLNGRIWFGTTEGATVFDPASEIIDSSSAKLIFDNIIIKNFKDQITDNNLELSYFHNPISFEYSLLSFFREADNKYSVQLVGIDDTQSEWTPDHKKDYFNLPSGKYVFKVFGKNFANIISGPLEFHFYINPPWWNTWWFYICCSLFISGISFLSIKFFINQKVKKRTEILERKNIIAKERARISEDMHDSIGSKLTRIAILSDRIVDNLNINFSSKDSIEDTMLKVSSIGQISREILDGMNEIIWSLSPRYDTVNSLLFFMNHYFNEMFESSNITTNFEFTEMDNDIILSPEIRRNIFLIFKEAVNNAIKHSQATIISSRVFIKDDKFYLEIKDNGIGFSEQDFDNIKSGKDAKFGLNNIKMRAEKISADLSIVSRFNEGTTLRLNILLKNKNNNPFEVF
ncbi:two-component regulator propeller domain-containing protein [Ignavibacterium sp.]|jgi:signal transduction histidine kinase/ligand-binding sensor domain-containing protein|uniref:ligand-binding sensor domain-containing protein n=1 Tax=Ignavibacterium sp. TaxID=2651167 RepID=UPI0025C4B0AC|nr:two-component regulator propeller domain-containing protein [Ignavibacterium sp.]